MNKALVALYKIDNTIIHNYNDNTLKFDLDKEEYYGTTYEGKFDPENTDCKSIDDFFECYEIIEHQIKAIDILKRKKVNLDIFSKVRSYKEYNWVVALKELALTKKEFELLREVF